MPVGDAVFTLPNLVLTDGYLSFDYPERLGKGGAIYARLHLSLAFSYAQVYAVYNQSSSPPAIKLGINQ